jgi:hypothetical protein
LIVMLVSIWPCRCLMSNKGTLSITEWVLEQQHKNGE